MRSSHKHFKWLFQKFCRTKCLSVSLLHCISLIYALVMNCNDQGVAWKTHLIVYICDNSLLHKYIIPLQNIGKVNTLKHTSAYMQLFLCVPFPCRTRFPEPYSQTHLRSTITSYNLLTRLRSGRAAKALKVCSCFPYVYSCRTTSNEKLCHKYDHFRLPKQQLYCMRITVSADCQPLALKAR